MNLNLDNLQPITPVAINLFGEWLSHAALWEPQADIHLPKPEKLELDLINALEIAVDECITQKPSDKVSFIIEKTTRHLCANWYQKNLLRYSPIYQRYAWIRAMAMMLENNIDALQATNSLYSYILDNAYPLGRYDFEHLNPTFNADVHATIASMSVGLNWEEHRLRMQNKCRDLLLDIMSTEQAYSFPAPKGCFNEAKIARFLAANNLTV